MAEKECLGRSTVGRRNAAEGAGLAASARALAELRAAVAARDAVILEMNHRVKNHLLLLAGLARRAAQSACATPAGVASEMETRLIAVAGVHDALHAAVRQGAVPADGFLARMCEPLLTGGHELELACDREITLRGDQLGPVGMIVTEAVCNAFKHGYPQGGLGHIRVAFERVGQRLALEVSDDGVGYAEAGGPVEGSGLRLMRSFTRSLMHGELKLGRSQAGGARLRLSFSA